MAKVIWYRAGRSVATAALLAVGLVGADLAAAPRADAAACAPPSYCAQAGACLSIGQVRRQVARAFPGAAVERIRLVGHAPTPTCLWYEVRLKGAQGRQVVYWRIEGGRAR